MKTEDFINEMIEEEKRLKSNPFLSTRIMTKIEAEQAPTKSKVYFLRSLTVAASFVLVIIIGIGIGRIYDNKETTNYTALNINDSQIENLNLYISGDYE